MPQAPSSDLTVLLIRVNQYSEESFVATTPNQSVLRSGLSQVSFEDAVETLLDRHFPGQLADVKQIAHNSAAVAALAIKPGRNSDKVIESRWFTAEVEIAD